MSDPCNRTLLKILIPNPLMMICLIFQEKRHKPRKFRCNLKSCRASFVTNWELKRHKLFHSDTRAHQCPTCSKRFIMASHLRDHKICVHTKQRLHKCLNPNCNKAFALKGNMMLHYKKNRCKAAKI
jgi:uncharacterized Zn-finger protein